MSSWHHLSSRVNEPAPGERFMLIGADGMPNNKLGKVKAVVSEDRAEGLFEIIDNFNATRIITEYTDDIPWIEVEYDL